MLYGVELVLDRETRQPADAIARTVVQKCQDAGLLLQARGSDGRTIVVRLVPPMGSTDAEVDEGLSMLRDALLSVGRSAKERRQQTAA